MEKICFCVTRLEISDWIALAEVFITGVFSLLLLVTTRNIGKRQNQLQENYNKIALNCTYRELYVFFSKLFSQCDLLFFDLETSVLAIVDERERKYFQVNIDKLEDLKKEYENHKIDFELYLSDKLMLSHSVFILLWTIESIYSSIKSLQMPMVFENLDNEKTQMLKKMIETINNKNHGYCINQDEDIMSISDKEYKNVLYEIWKVLYDSKWTADLFLKSSDNDRIEHLSNQLLTLTDNINIRNWCSQFVSFRDVIFKQYGILEYVKNKCVIN